MLDHVVDRIKPIAAPAFLLAASLGLSGCFFANFTEVPGVPLEELDMSGEAPVEIAVAGPDNVILTEGDTLDITVEGGTKTEDLRFDLDGSKLRIGRDGDWMSGGDPATIRVTMPAPRDISLAGSGNLEAPAIASETEIGIAGSGDLSISQIEAERLEVSMAGSGSITGAGTAKTLEISIAGSGDVEFANLSADEVEISIAGSGDIALTSDGNVSASIAGSGSIDVTGSATCKASTVGSGSLNCKPAASTASAEDAADTADEGTSEGGDEAAAE